MFSREEDLPRTDISQKESGAEEPRTFRSSGVGMRGWKFGAEGKGLVGLKNRFN